MTEGIKIMGIVNLTDNSFYAPSRLLGQRPEAVLRRVDQMLDEGADIIDIGACSSRPGSEPVGEDVEWARLHPVLSAVRTAHPRLTISIDTYFSSVVQKAHALVGERLMINDISAGEEDPEMLPLVGRLGIGYIAMHKRGTPRTMQGLCDYGNVVEDVAEYFRAFAGKARIHGIRDWILDPGFGFAKTIEQNYGLLAHLPRFAEFGREILVGVSRKSMVYRLHGIAPEDSLVQTQVLHLAALQGGATILRVHDVAEAARTIRTWAMLN